MVHGIRLGVLTFGLVVFSIWPEANAACYYPSGKNAPNDIPCRDDTSHATCCGPGYACLSNGICQATGEEQGSRDASEFVRGSCTDESWRNSNCPLFCIEDGVDFLAGGNGIAKCDNMSDDVYYCINSESSGQATCEDRDRRLFFPGMLRRDKYNSFLPAQILTTSRNPICHYHYWRCTVNNFLVFQHQFHHIRQYGCLFLFLILILILVLNL